MQCSYCFFGTITYTVRKKVSDKHGGILMIELLINDTNFRLINLHNTNTENDQLATFSELTNLLLKINQYLQVISICFLIEV